MHQLAVAYNHAGRLPEAAALHEQALAARRRTLGPEHRDTIASTTELGRVWTVTGRQAEGLALIEGTVRDGKAHVGADDPSTLEAMRFLGMLYLQRLGRGAEGIALIEEILRLTKAKLGPWHSDTLFAMNALAGAYLVAGRASDAVPLSREALRVARERPEVDPMTTILGLAMLAQVYRHAGRRDEALPLLEELLPIAKAKLGPTNPATAEVQAALAEAYRQAGRPKEALPLFDAALPIIWTMEPDKTYAMRVARDMELASVAANDPARADAARDRYAAGARARLDALPVEAAERPELLAGLGGAYLRLRKYAEAEQPLRESLALREKKEPDAWPTFHARSLLGGSLLGQTKYADAEQFLLAGYEGMRQREVKMQPKDKPYLSDALERLVQLYDAWGKKDRAGEWRTKRDASKPKESANKK